ncbi:Optic atrophy 1, isoform A [Chamberlinius hualienensis]
MQRVLQVPFRPTTSTLRCYSQNKFKRNVYIKVIKSQLYQDYWRSRYYSTLQCRVHENSARKLNRLLIRPQTLSHERNIVTIITKVVRSALKIRYIVLGTAVGGGIELRRRYDDLKSMMPDFSWMETMMPSDDNLGAFRSSLIDFKKKVSESFSSPEEGSSWFKNSLSFADGKLREIGNWFDETAKMADRELNNMENGAPVEKPKTVDDDRRRSIPSDRERIDKVQQELINVQMKYQKEIERLESENKELRKQLMLKNNPVKSKRKIKKSLIDMYSDVLDELAGYDSTYNTQDHLPRVVVVGDQSSGKTSVLEMIAQARIFPRGAGEMMTRTPVKVTLSEGPYHIAQFKDSSREYDLTKESELSDLRRDIEIRMKRNISGGKTVSNEVISITVKGPGLPRMVLIDLPGIISTVTTNMAPDTREAIKKMSQLYMSNPNAIILCIQDGSVDAERSNVTDLVSQMDPNGKRTIFVLTKVDLAEENMTNPERIRQILQGKLFPMKALGYFAVVTGRGNKEDSIDTIKAYEEKFFRSSRLFKTGVLSATQMTTQNLSFAVADRFWKMVKESIEQQTDAFKATRFNLETEWSNTFPRLRELDRGELFEKARGEILDEIINLSQLTPKQWEEALVKKLWEKMAAYVFEEIYIPAAQTHNSGTFNTIADIKLKLWADNILPLQCIKVGWETLKEEFKNLMEKAKTSKDHDDIFDNLKDAVIDEAINQHVWEDKAFEVLRVIQLNAFEDRSVPEKVQWDQSVIFLEYSLQEKLKTVEAKLAELNGPGRWEKWVYWKSANEQQQMHSSVRSELEKLLSSNEFRSPNLTQEELTTVRKNIETNGGNVTNEFIESTWHPVYRRYFLKKSISRARECRKSFYLYQQGLDSDLDCDDVVLFWRIQKMLTITSNALRQQIMNREARRLEKEIKEVLDDYSQDKQRKESLLCGRRVQLAEELKRIRKIQDKLEEFIKALNMEK